MIEQPGASRTNYADSSVGQILHRPIRGLSEALLEDVGGF